MRWFWRLLTLFLLLAFLQPKIYPEPKAFIAWPVVQTWALKMQGEMKQLQRVTQDLPASLEVEVRRLWKDFGPNGDGKEV